METIQQNEKKAENSLPLRGREYPLQIMRSLRRPAVRLSDGVICVNLYAPLPGDPYALLKSWYKKQALSLLTQKTIFWAQQIGVTFHKISIKDQKTRWGSCSSLGNINYNWRIIMAPDPAIDYLVIHELCHRAHLNHSASFWEMTRLYAPDYKEQKLWLKQHGQSYFNICPNKN